MIVGVPAETYPGERRVALVPGDIARLTTRKIDVVVQVSAGDAAGYPDSLYAAQGATLVAERRDVFARADLLMQVRAAGANARTGDADLALYRQGQAVVGFMDPLGAPEAGSRLAARGVDMFAVELIPRITKAQSMDALSSMASIAGYRAVLLAAVQSPKLFPMMMTAAGTISPAKVFVLGAGVAGLQAIATAKRLGAVVEAYDVRPEVKEQVQSVGGKFVTLELDTSDASGAGGYAQAQSDAFYAKQQELMTEYLRAADVVITTAAVPGRRAPRLVSAAMVAQMRPGSVLVDLAAETGGNCELTRVGEVAEQDGVHIIGPANVPSDVSHHASQMYSRNLTSLVAHLTDSDGNLELDPEDEITAAVLVAHGGELVHERVKAQLAAAGESNS
jgi:NAD(P) transhydrogenase subunit alpha